jgi:hypothetical protein
MSILPGVGRSFFEREEGLNFLCHLKEMEKGKEKKKAFLPAEWTYICQKAYPKQLLGGSGVSSCFVLLCSFA